MLDGGEGGWRGRRRGGGRGRKRVGGGGGVGGEEGAQVAADVLLGTSRKGHGYFVVFAGRDEEAGLAVGLGMGVGEGRRVEPGHTVDMAGEHGNLVGGVEGEVGVDEDEQRFGEDGLQWEVWREARPGEGVRVEDY